MMIYKTMKLNQDYLNKIKTIMLEIITTTIASITSSSWSMKILAFILAFFTPAKELLLLLLFLTALDWIIDVVRWIFKKSERDMKDIFKDITLQFIIKVIMYIVLAIALNATQLYLLKESVDLFKYIMAIPIISELLSVSMKVELATGIQISKPIADIFSKFKNKSKIDFKD